MSITNHMVHGQGHYVPSDSAKQQILSARTFMTRTLTLTGTDKVRVPVPSGVYEVVCQSNVSFKVYETAETYTENTGGAVVTYGTGMSGTTLTIPVYDRDFYISGSANQVITLLFPSLRSVKG